MRKYVYAVLVVSLSFGAASCTQDYMPSRVVLPSSQESADRSAAIQIYNNLDYWFQNDEFLTEQEKVDIRSAVTRWRERGSTRETWDVVSPAYERFGWSSGGEVGDSVDAFLASWRGSLERRGEL